MYKTNINKALIDKYLQNFPEEAADILSTYAEADIHSYLQNQPLETACNVFVKLNKNAAAEVAEIMENDLFAGIFSKIDPYKSALILSLLKQNVVEAKLSLLPKRLSDEIKELMTYPNETAGFLMNTNVTTFKPENTVKEVLKKLRLIKDRKISNIYVINSEEQLIGKVPIQDIAISSPGELLKNIMEESQSIYVMAHSDEIVEILRDHKVLGLPVVDIDNKLLGVIRNDSLLKAAQQDAAEDVQVMFGAGREETALSKIGLAVRKRLPWLEINLATAFLAAAVVGLFEDTIAQITVLAVFLPVVAGQSGNTGSQALAVIMRGLALREIRPSQWFKVVRKEASVGFINGVAVALTTSVIVFFWASSFGLAIIIAVSMVFSMVIAGLSGAAIPILLKSIGQDPAQSSSIILTTVTDIVGFFSFLGLATVLGTTLGIF